MHFILQFYDAWKGLCDWIDENERKMKKYTSTPSKVKNDMDELKVSFPGNDRAILSSQFRIFSNVVKFDFSPKTGRIALLMTVGEMVSSCCKKLTMDPPLPLYSDKCQIRQQSG